MLFLPLVALCQAGDYLIKGKLTNVKVPTKIYLVNAEDQELMDSAIVKNGLFSFKGKIVNAKGAFLIANKSKLEQNADSRFLFLEQGTIQVTSQEESLKAVSVSGSATNDDVVLFDKLVKDAKRPIQSQIDKKQKETSPDQQKSEAFKNDLLLLENQKMDAVKKAFREFIKTHPNSLVGLNGLTELADVDEFETVNALYEGLTPAVQNSPIGKRFGKKLSVLKKVSIGALIPDLALEDTSGVFTNLSSFKGHYVLIDVWASWCGPCRQENPNQLRAYNKYKGQNFKVVGMSLDTDKGKWRDAIQKDGLTWTQLIDTEAWQGPVVTTFGLNSIPQNYLIDPNGVIIGKNLIGLDLHTKLAELFGPGN